MFKKLSGFALALVGLTVLLGSCKKDYESIQSVDSKKIQDYISKNNLTVTEDPLKSGYYYQILNEGTGDYYKDTDSVLYDAVVKGLENGTTYTTSPLNGNLGTYVGYTNTFLRIAMPAVRDVIRKLKPGGSARIILPSFLAFGKNGLSDSNYSIPSNENLDVTITTYAETQAERDERLIKTIIATQGLKMTRDPSGIYYSIVDPGTDTVAITTYSNVTTSYTLRLKDGVVLQTGTDFSFSMYPKSATTILAPIIIFPGKLVKGGKMRMLIPSVYAYGTSGNTGVPANAILDYDWEITAVTK